VGLLRDGFTGSTLPGSDVFAIGVINLTYDTKVRYYTGSLCGLDENGFTGWGLKKTGGAGRCLDFTVERILLRCLDRMIGSCLLLL